MAGCVAKSRSLESIAADGVQANLSGASEHEPRLNDKQTGNMIYNFSINILIFFFISERDFLSHIYNVSYHCLMKMEII